MDVKPENTVEFAIAKDLGWRTQLLEASVSSCVKEDIVETKHPAQSLRKEQTLVFMLFPRCAHTLFKRDEFCYTLLSFGNPSANQNVPRSPFGKDRQVPPLLWLGGAVRE